MGEWLPEPVPTEAFASATTDPGEAVVHAETLSMAMLLVLETLSPLERAVFILREAFGYSHAEVADSIGRSEVAVRQLAARARRHVDARRPRFETDPAIQRDVAERFMAASREGDIDALMRLLAPEVEFVADGGGLARAPLHPVDGADRVTRFLLATGARMGADQRMAVVDLNGGPGIVSWEGETMIAAATLVVVDGRVQRILLVANPEKLGALRPRSAMSRDGGVAASLVRNHPSRPGGPHGHPSASRRHPRVRRPADRQPDDVQTRRHGRRDTGQPRGGRPSRVLPAPGRHRARRSGSAGTARSRSPRAPSVGR